MPKKTIKGRVFHKPKGSKRFTPVKKHNSAHRKKK